MKFKIICSNKDGDIIIDGDELKSAIKAKEQGRPITFKRGIVLNWNMYAGIVKAKDNRGWQEKRIDKFVDEDPSDFAKYLAKDMKALSPEDRTKAQEKNE